MEENNILDTFKFQYKPLTIQPLNCHIDRFFLFKWDKMHFYI